MSSDRAIDDNMSEGARVIVAPGESLEGWRGKVTHLDGDERCVKFDNGESEWLFVQDLAIDADCESEPVYGELWCRTHDTAYPCVIGALIGDDQ